MSRVCWCGADVNGVGRLLPDSILLNDGGTTTWDGSNLVSAAESSEREQEGPDEYHCQHGRSFPMYTSVVCPSKFIAREPMVLSINLHSHVMTCLDQA